jgi:hypothetical protein
MAMHKESTRLLWSVLLTTLLALLAPITPASAAGNPSATGGGTTLEGDEKSTFVFNAVEQPDGTVEGHLVYHFRALDASFQMDINCLNIVGNRAVISGVVTKVTGPAPEFLVEGAGGVFQVEDNGEGGDAPPDLISDVFIFPPDIEQENCRSLFPEPYLPIDGNVQVNP